MFRYEDSGTYCCRLHNGKGNSQVHFSQEAVVIVKAHEDHHHPIVKIPGEFSYNEIKALACTVHFHHH